MTVRTGNKIIIKELKIQITEFNSNSGVGHLTVTFTKMEERFRRLNILSFQHVFKSVEFFNGSNVVWEVIPFRNRRGNNRISIKGMAISGGVELISSF